MKRILQILSATALIVGVAFGISSCSKTSFDLAKVQLTDVRNEQSAMENFSVALSQAVFSYQEVRHFLKTEAMKRFDYEDEVFYPLVKDSNIGNLGTFREILVRELGGEEKMVQIEKELPTLTILVSDATWFDPEGFCLDRWDTSDAHVAITCQERDGFCRKLYGNGYLLGEIEEGTIPGGSVLIVKKSERMVASAPTKSGGVEYSFLFDEFDASKNPVDTKGRYSWDWLNEPQPEDTDYFSETALNSINPDIIKAYNLFKNDSYACHNDYIFYGMTSNNTKGRLRLDVKNRICRIKIPARAFGTIFDDKEKNDLNFVNVFETTDNGKGYNAEPTRDQIYAKLWGDGLLEIVFTILAGNHSGTESVYPLSVRARNLFTVKDNVVMKEQWKAAWWDPSQWHIGWRYTFGRFGTDYFTRNDETLKERWYYLPYPIMIPSWDLLELSSYTVKVEEVDCGASYTKEETVTTKHASSNSQKFNLDVNGGKKDTLNVGAKLELGWSNSDEVTRTEKQTVTYNDLNDPLLSATISYSDRIVRGRDGSKYAVSDYVSGDFYMTVLPYRY